MKSKKFFAVAGVLIETLCFFAILYVSVGTITTELKITGGFTLFAMLLSLAGVLAYYTEPVVEVYFYLLPALYTGVIYLFVQGVAAIALSVFAPPLQTLLIIELLITGIMGSIQCYVIYAGIRARDVNQRAHGKVSPMRSLVKEAESLMGCTSDYTWQRRIKTVIDDIRYANPVTEGDTALAERQIHADLDALRRAVLDNDQTAFDRAAASIRRCLGDRKIMR